MSKHTPGPWSVPIVTLSTDVQVLGNQGERYVMAGEGDDRKRVAVVDCQTKFKRGEGWRIPCEERDANAHLIAAAPELLEALMQLFDEANGFNVSGVYFNEKCFQHEGLGMAARAIAKARGEA